jgi:hypothetical protein
VNKTKLKRIISMHKDGLSTILCIAAIIEMGNEEKLSSSQLAYWITLFHKEKCLELKKS